MLPQFGRSSSGVNHLAQSRAPSPTTRRAGLSDADEEFLLGVLEK